MTVELNNCFIIRRITDNKFGAYPLRKVLATTTVVGYRKSPYEKMTYKCEPAAEILNQQIKIFFENEFIPFITKILPKAKIETSYGGKHISNLSICDVNYLYDCLNYKGKNVCFDPEPKDEDDTE